MLCNRTECGREGKVTPAVVLREDRGRGSLLFASELTAPSVRLVSDLCLCVEHGREVVERPGKLANVDVVRLARDALQAATGREVADWILEIELLAADDPAALTVRREVARVEGLRKAAGHG